LFVKFGGKKVHPITYDYSRRLSWPIVDGNFREVIKCDRCDNEVISYYEGIQVTKNVDEYSNLCAYCYYEIYSKNNKFERIPFLDSSRSLMILDLGTNKAIYYFNPREEKYENSGYFNKYYIYCFWKEVNNKFVDLKTYDDYLFKLIALYIISDWEEGKSYKAEIKRFKKYIKGNLDSNFDFEKAMELNDNPLGIEIYEAFYNEFWNKVINFYTASNKYKRLEAIDNIMHYLEGYEWTQFKYNDTIYNLWDINEKVIYEEDEYDLGILAHKFQENLSSKHSDVQAEVFYYSFKYNKNKNHLLKSLSAIYNALEFREFWTPMNFEDKVGDYNGEKEEFKLIEKIVLVIDNFYNAYKKEIKYMEFNGKYKVLTDLPLSTEMIYKGYNINNKYDELTLISILRNSIEPLSTLKKVLNELIENKNDLCYKFEEWEFLDENRLMFLEPYNKFIDILYLNNDCLKEKVGEQNNNTDIKYYGQLRMMFDEMKEMLEKNFSLEAIRNSFVEKKNTMLKTLSEEEFGEVKNDFYDFFEYLGKKASEEYKEHNFLEVRKRLEKELQELRHKLPLSAFASLVTGEYLYEVLVSNNQTHMEKDYSCVSIMYYMALEDALKQIIVTQSNKESYIVNRLRSYDDKKWLGTLGNFSHLFKDMKYGKYLEVFKHIEKIFKPDLCLDEIKLKELLYDYGSKLSNISNSRNNAAHGGKIISYNQVKKDKQNVYELETSNQYMKLLIEFLKMLK
jgi:hypothetical protein